MIPRLKVEDRERNRQASAAADRALISSSIAQASRAAFSEIRTRSGPASRAIRAAGMALRESIIEKL